MAAFLTTDFSVVGLTALVATGFTATGFTATAFFTALGAAGFAATEATAFVATALGAAFLASTFGAGAATAFAEVFLVAFPAETGVALVAFFAALPPKIPFQPSEYFSFVPTRVIVTESPFDRN